MCIDNAGAGTDNAGVYTDNAGAGTGKVKTFPEGSDLQRRLVRRLVLPGNENGGSG